jgi:membrane-associated PAP2 superfamily phosphatase
MPSPVTGPQGARRNAQLLKLTPSPLKPSAARSPAMSTPHLATTPAPLSTQRGALITLALLMLLLAWEASGLDMPLAQLAGDVHGFAWRDNWLLSNVLHEFARRASWALALGLCLVVWWPVGWFKQISTAQRLQLASTALLAALVVTALKGLSTTSCPWDLQNFGGLARYAPHWHSWGATDGGSGHCFPAGHASSGFSFIGGYFAFQAYNRRLALGWLIAAVTAGLVLGVAQQLRGAHFMSHTLWTGWLCWSIAWAVDRLWHRYSRPTALIPPAQP